MTQNAHFFSERYMYPLFGVFVFALCIIVENMLISFKKYTSGIIIYGVLLLVLTMNGISYEYNYLCDVSKMQKDTIRMVDEIKSSTDTDKLIVTNNEQLGWTVLNYYFPEYEIMLSNDSSSQEGTDLVAGWYMLSKGTDINSVIKNEMKTVYIDAGVFGYGYDVTLYKIY